MGNVAKLAQPLTEGLDTRRYGGRGSGAKKADPRNLYCLLRLCPRPAHREHDDDSKSPRPFSILDFRLSEKESGHRIQVLLFMLFSLNRKPVLSLCRRIGNPKSKIT